MQNHGEATESNNAIPKTTNSSLEQHDISRSVSVSPPQQTSPSRGAAKDCANKQRGDNGLAEAGKGSCEASTDGKADEQLLDGRSVASRVKARKKKERLNESKIVRDLTSAIMCLFLFYMALTLLTTAVSLKFIIDCRQLLSPCTQQSSVNPCWKTITPIVINCSTFIIMFCSCCCSSPRWLSAILWISAVINASFAVALIIPDGDAAGALRDLISNFFSSAFYYKCDPANEQFSFRSANMHVFEAGRVKEIEETCAKCLSMVTSQVQACSETSLNRLKFYFYCARVHRNELQFLQTAIKAQLAAANNWNAAGQNVSITVHKHLSVDAARAADIIKMQYGFCLRSLHDFTAKNYDRVNIGTSVILLVCALVNLPIGVYIWRLACRHHQLKQLSFISHEHRNPFRSILIRIMPLFQALHTDTV